MKVFPYFTVCSYRVVSERTNGDISRAEAAVEVEVGDSRVRREATGVGPVHALDNALRECLRTDFPELEQVRLSDYRVSVVDASKATGADVRVIIQATDGQQSWDAGCISGNIIDASFEALCSAAVMGILRARNERLPTA